jgi:hypothetical protein
MGFRVGDRAAPSLSEAQRVQLIGQCTDLNTLTWTISTIRRHTLPKEHNHAFRPSPTHQWNTSILYLPHLENTPMLPPRGTHDHMHPPQLAPTPLQWVPKCRPEQWVYTDGSDIKGQPRLGAAVVHVPTCKTLYIDARGIKETRTIMLAELVAIYTALDKFDAHEWVGIFTYPLSSL